MASKTKIGTFYEFGDFANELVGTRRDKVRWCVDGARRIDDAIYLALPADGTARVRGWPKDFEVKAQQKSRVQDMPCTLACRPVVSDRLRRLIEKLSPNSAQYLPLRITWGGKAIGGKYWVANWQKVIDCVDWNKSKPRVKQPVKEPVIFENLVLLQRRIPKNVHVFIVKHAVQTVLCSQELRDAIDAAGITGCHYLTLD